MGNPVKMKLAQGQVTVGHWLSFPSPSVAELMASFGMDWLLIDTEHGPASYETVEDMIRAMRGTQVVPLIRVAGNDPVLIKKALDRGAYGVIVPLVNTAEEAEAAVQACRYPPAGIRGIAGTRETRYGLDLRGYFDRWNDDVLVVIQVETRAALDNIDAIASVPGVDVLFIGPNDLSAALGLFQQFDHPEFKAAVQRILQAADRHGIAAGYMASDADSVLARAREGFRFIAAGTDARLLAGATASTYRAIRAGLQQAGLQREG